MTILLYVEGETEKYLPAFFKRWLDPKLKAPVRIEPINLAGVANYLKDIQRRANLGLAQPHVMGGVGLIDLYGSGLPYPDGRVEEKYQWARRHVESRVRNARFRQHFAMHETEAWLFSEPRIFPRKIRDGIPDSPPETVNLNNPPSRRLGNLYRTRLDRKYTKPLEGAKLFRALDPDIACERCPHLALLFQDLLDLARPDN